MLIKIIYIAIFTVWVSSALAQDSIDIERAAAGAEYYKALVTYEKMPKRRLTTAAAIAAAKSYWALSLPEQAIAEYDQALRDTALTSVARARIHLSRGILEFQEGRAETAVLFAEKSVSDLKEPSPLRAKAWALYGQSLASTAHLADAELKFENALAESGPEDRAEVSFLLGQVRLKLGKFEDARLSFENVPQNHDRTPEALRYLAAIALESGKYENAEFWLARGRTDFPNQFLDSWTDYALITTGIKRDDLTKVRLIRQAANQKYPPSDPWLSLLNAAAESYEFSRRGLKE